MTKVEQWPSSPALELEQPLGVSQKHQFILPEISRSQEVESSCLYEFEMQSAILANSLPIKILAADRFTLADLFVSHVLMWAHSKGYTDKRHQNIVDYISRMRKCSHLLKQKILQLH
ncbi:MAG: hypothetical protein R2827_11140 [Bdellovibrionales bacterium]